MKEYIERKKDRMNNGAKLPKKRPGKTAAELMAERRKKQKAKKKAYNTRSGY